MVCSSCADIRIRERNRGEEFGSSQIVGGLGIVGASLRAIEVREPRDRRKRIGHMIKRYCSSGQIICVSVGERRDNHVEAFLDRGPASGDSASSKIEG